MSKSIFLLSALLLLSAAFAFSIDSYESDAVVRPNGDLLINERIIFTLEKEYNEGFRSIRPQDCPSLSALEVHSVKVNGREANHYTQIYEGNAEIVWTETSKGQNIVELSYTLEDRVELWDDFAKICFEHYGANWAVPASTFRSTMALPESTRNTEMHFEVYSEKKGEAYIEDLTIVIELTNIPSGNYVGGCYLFDKSAVSTSNTVNGSALEILEEERLIYGSESVLSPADAFPFAPCCLPAFLVLLLIAGFYFLDRPKFTKLPESIMPPSKEDPAAVSVILRGQYKDQEVLAATILELINKGAIDIMELEKEGYTGQEIKRERTILFLKTTSKKLAPHEKTAIDLIFDGGKKKKVDLDALAEEFKNVKDQKEAKKTIIPKKMDEFKKQIKDSIKQKKLYKHSQAHELKMGSLATVAMIALLFFIFFLLPNSLGFFDFLNYLAEEGNTPYLAYVLIGTFGSFFSALAAAYLHMQVPPPKGREKAYSHWHAFSRAVKSSSLKGEPPSGAFIWGEILVYATALGIADKVKKHLSELDELLAERIERMDEVRASSYAVYTSAWGVRNLSKTGNRSGRSSGGFSTGSTGGWSSGGGGFSGGSSGGGGFR